MIVDIKKIEINGITYKWITNADTRDTEFLEKLFTIYYDGVLAYPSILDDCVNRKWISPSPENFQEIEIGLYIPETKFQDEYYKEYESKVGQPWWK